ACFCSAHAPPGSPPLSLHDALPISAAFAQQRPLVTEDPETIGAGRVLVEAGIDYAHDQHYPVSGLNGNLWRLPTIGISLGLSSRSEEHTSELQSRGHLVCRLLLEKK